MNDTYRRLWILLREKLTGQANKAEEFSTKRQTLHEILTLMAEMEACEFLED